MGDSKVSLIISKKVQAFFSDYPVRTFNKGSIIIQAGSDPAGVFYLVEGRVIQYDVSRSGGTIVVNAFKPPAFFPMSWAINRTPNSYFFEAATTVKVRMAPAEQVVAFLRSNPDVSLDLLARVYRGTDGVLRRMAHLMGGNARSRILFELINIALRFGMTHDSKLVMLGVTETDLAKHTGLARESISRELKSLKTSGQISVSRRGIVINNLERIKQLLGDEL